MKESLAGDPGRHFSPYGLFRISSRTRYPVIPGAPAESESHLKYGGMCQMKYMGWFE
jgi:hypothetical protein